MDYFNWTWFCGIYKLLWLIHVDWAFLNQNQWNILGALNKMTVKCSADQLNSDYNFLNISARDLILVSNHMFSEYRMKYIIYG